MAADKGVLALTDDAVLRPSAVSDALEGLQNEGFEWNDVLIATQASSLDRLPLESSSMDLVVALCKSIEFPMVLLLDEIFRVMKPGGNIILNLDPHATRSLSDEVPCSVNRKLLVVGFLEPVLSQTKSDTPSKVPHLGIRAIKPAWKIGSSFSLKKVPKSLPKVQINDDSDLIDEDSLISEEDLKKPQLPVVGDCEVGSMRKACKNCTCGRAEAEERVQKLGLTAEQIDNPQSACGNCGLGDAFRCSTCPYRGLPPFRLGEKVSLPGNFLSADI